MGALVVVWTTIMMFQTHLVLLEDQKDEASSSNTAGYFALNYVFLAAGIGIATLLNRRRRRTVASTASTVTATRNEQARAS